MPKTSDELLSFLDSLGIATGTVRHPPIFTVAEAQARRGEIAGAHTKNLFLKDRKDNYFLVTVEEEAAVDLKRIHEVIGAAGRVSFGKPDAMMDLLGVVPGAVTLFGLINDTDGRVKFVIDEALMAETVINAHPLVNTATTALGPADVRRFAEATGHAVFVLKVAA